ncbi:hypothetical protein [Paracoccus denitrificans]|uniref:hypothetical protein n=1 Tax=Paracoccus denitrificans TaxID=266 RepID=UPI00336501A4
MTLMSFVAPFALLLVGFVVAVSAGAARDADLLSPTKPLTVLLIAAIFLTLQAILWVRLGTYL